ncbi:MAG TPA: MgtC/SapB family protein [Kaistia sp.]|nr:MgtC/SapB family protein [Kaistia sp.]
MFEFAEAAFLETHLPKSQIALRFIAASVLGALIGAEREWRSRPAGLRTHTLTALASAVFTIVMLEILHSDTLGMEHVQVDPIRIIEAVTAGVAFLAAGAIIQSRGQVQGLTTGAAMWLAGAVGVACGLGYVSVGAMATAICLVVIILLGLLHAKSPEPDRDR